MGALASAVVLLGAAVIAVPVFKKLRLGAILGYLVAGVVIGPSALNLVSDPDTIMHLAEFGVVLLLFLIGIELAPEKLWRMRNAVIFTGGGQLLITAFIVTASAGALMVSRFSYNSFKEINVDGRISFTYAFAIPLMFIMIAANPPLVLFMLAFVYAVSGPLLHIWRSPRPGSDESAPSDPSGPSGESQDS